MVEFFLRFVTAFELTTQKHSTKQRNNSYAPLEDENNYDKQNERDTLSLATTRWFPSILKIFSGF